MEASHFYNNVLQELQRSFQIPELNMPLNNVPSSLAFPIELIEYRDQKFTVKEINASLFDRYIDAGLHSSLIAYVESYNHLHARLGNRITEITNQLMVGSKGLQFDSRMDASKIGDLSRFL